VLPALPTAVALEDSVIRDRHVLAEEANNLSSTLLQVAHFYPEDGTGGDQLIPVTFTRRGLIHVVTMLRQLAMSGQGS
jgi:hypothetical protein